MARIPALFRPGHLKLTLDYFIILELFLDPSKNLKSIWERRWRRGMAFEEFARAQDHARFCLHFLEEKNSYIFIASN